MIHDVDGDSLSDRSQNRAQSVIMELSFNIGDNHISGPGQQVQERLRGLTFAKN